MSNEIRVNRDVANATGKYEDPLIAQADKYRNIDNLGNQSYRIPKSNSARKALISACLIPIGNFIAAGCAIYFGHKGLRETEGNKASGKGSAIFALIAGYVVTIPVLFLYALRLMH